MPLLSNAEIDAIITVLWHTHAIRSYYEDRALFEDEVRWKTNGGVFPKFSRYHSDKWTQIMGPDDPTVRGRRISRSSMRQARRDFENSYREPVRFALELVDRVRMAIAEAVEENGSSEDGEYENEVGIKAWAEIASDPSVKEEFIKIARNWCNVDATSFQL